MNGGKSMHIVRIEAYQHCPASINSGAEPATYAEPQRHTGAEAGVVVQKHHVIPKEVVEKHTEFFAALETAGFDRDRSDNMVDLPASEAGSLETGAARHYGSHPRYNDLVFDAVQAIMDEAEERVVDQLAAALGPAERAALRQRCYAAQYEEVKRLQKSLKYLLGATRPDGRPFIVLNAADPRANGRAERRIIYETMAEMTLADLNRLCADPAEQDAANRQTGRPRSAAPPTGRQREPQNHV